MKLYYGDCGNGEATLYVANDKLQWYERYDCDGTPDLPCYEADELDKIYNYLEAIADSGYDLYGASEETEDKTEFEMWLENSDIVAEL